MVATGDFRLDGAQDVMRAVAELAVGGVGVVLRRLLAVDAGGILALLFAMALAAVDAAPAFPGCGTSLMSLWQATQSRAAWGDAFKAAALKPGGTPGWRFPLRGPESWQPAQSSERSAAGLLAAEAGCQSAQADQDRENQVPAGASRVYWTFRTHLVHNRYSDL